MLDNQVFTRKLTQEEVFRWLAFSVIALAVFIFYFPSLTFPPRADQVIYLSETANQHPVNLIIGDYDHNRHRTIAPGDELLFRPLLYVFLGTEQVIFGHHFWAWQLLGLVAHLILIWVLLRFLCRLINCWLAFAGTWLFALAVVNYELVSWTHLSSYILMMVCVVASLEQVFICFEENQVAWGRIYRILIYAFIASFIYETANIFILCMMGGLMISFPRMKWRLQILCLPVVLYAFFSFYNFQYINHVTHLANGITHGISVGKYLSSILYLSLWWLYEGLFNGMYHYLLAIRTMFQLDEVMVFKPLVLNNLQVILELIILGAFSGLLWINRGQLFKRLGLITILMGMLLAYVAVIVFGRYQEIGNLKQTVAVNSYFPYIFWVIVVIMAFLLIAAKENKSKWQRVFIAAFVTASIFSGLCQGSRIYYMAASYSRATNDIILLVATIDLLIQEKKNEPNFSFYVDPDYPGNYPYGNMRKITDPLGKRYTFAEFLYPQYFRPKEEAKYKFLVRKIESGSKKMGLDIGF